MIIVDKRDVTAKHIDGAGINRICCCFTFYMLINNLNKCKFRPHQCCSKGLIAVDVKY